MRKATVLSHQKMEAKMYLYTKQVLQLEINEGDQVSYEVEDGQKGPSAVNVTLV